MSRVIGLGRRGSVVIAFQGTDPGQAERLTEYLRADGLQIETLACGDGDAAFSKIDYETVRNSGQTLVLLPANGQLSQKLYTVCVIAFANDMLKLASFGTVANSSVPFSSLYGQVFDLSSWTDSENEMLNFADRRVQAYAPPETKPRSRSRTRAIAVPLGAFAVAAVLTTLVLVSGVFETGATDSRTLGEFSDSLFDTNDPTSITPSDELRTVAGLQRALFELGYFEGDPNGQWNNDLEYAVKEFQTDEGLTVDGVAGPQTRDAIERRLIACRETQCP